MWWIVGGVVALAVLLFVVVLLVVGRRFRPFGRAVRRLRLRQEQAEALQGKLVVMQEHLVDLQQSVEEATSRAEQVKAGRTGA
jgi:membrane protein implicated in regulation of membrane protease activity